MTDTPSLSDLFAAWPTQDRLSVDLNQLTAIHTALDKALLADPLVARSTIADLTQQVQHLDSVVFTDATKDNVAVPTFLLPQVEGVRRFIDNGGFATPADRQRFLETVLIPRAELLGAICGFSKPWHLRRLHELARGTLLLHTLLQHPRYAIRGRAVLPHTLLESKNLSLADLKQTPSEALKRVLWKVSVRARDAFAQGRDFVDDLPRKQARDFKQWWMEGVFLLGDLEKRGYDVSKGPLQLTRFQQLHIRWLGSFGKAAFK